MTDLDVSNNSITFISHVYRLCQLKTLRIGKIKLTLDENNIVQFESTGVMDSLESLNLNGNQISTLDCSPFPQLTTLLLDRNRFTSCNDLYDLPVLKLLSLDDQQITSVNAHETLKNVCDISLAGNPLVNLNDIKVQRFRSVCLSSINALQVPDFVLAQIQLETLNLNMNCIEDISCIGQLVTLKQLYLADNKISEIGMVCRTIASLHSLLALNME